MSEIQRELGRLARSLEKLSDHLAVDSVLNLNNDVGTKLVGWQKDTRRAARLILGYSDLLKLTVQALPTTTADRTRRYDVPVHAKARPCRYCGSRIYWGRSDSGARIPLDPDGRNHQSWCEKQRGAAAEWRGGSDSKEARE